MATTFVIQALGLISGAELARLLGVENRGLLAALFLAPTIVTHLGDLGGPIAYGFLSSSQPAKTAALVGNAFLLVAIQAIVLSAIGVPAILLLLHRYGSLAVVSALFLVVYLPLNLTYRYFSFLNLGLRRYVAFNLVRLMLPVSFVSGVAILFFFHLRDVRVALLMYAVSHAVVAILACGQVIRRIRPKLDLSLMRRTMIYGLKAHIGNLTPVDSLQLDLAVVVMFLGPRSAGLYAIGVSAGMIVRAYGGALGLVALPHVAGSTDAVTRRRRAGEIFRFCLLLTSSTAAVIVLGASLLVPAIYGSQFEPAVPIVRLLVFGMVFASLRQVLGDCLRAADRPLSGTLAEAASWLVAVVGLVTLARPLGTLGAAIAVDLSYLAALMIMIGFARRMGFSMRELFLPGKQDLKLAARVGQSVLAVFVPALRFHRATR